MRNDATSDKRRFLKEIMRPQAKLSLGLAVIFVLILVLLPLLNLYAPSLTNLSVGGFTVTWLILGVLFYPLTWLLSYLFVSRSEALEAEMVKHHTRDSEDTK